MQHPARALVSEVRARTSEWERVYGQPNYPENLALAVQLADAVETLLEDVDDPSQYLLDA